MPAGYLTHLGGKPPYSNPPGHVLVYRLNAKGNAYFLDKTIGESEPFPSLSPDYFGNAVSTWRGSYIIGVPGKEVEGVSQAGTVAFGYIE